MKPILLISLLATLLVTVFGQDVKNSTREFKLKTNLKPNQAGKGRFKNLYLESYHTGAGLDDAVLISTPRNPIKGFLNGTVGKSQGTTCK